MISLVLVSWDRLEEQFGRAQAPGSEHPGWALHLFRFSCSLPGSKRDFSAEVLNPLDGALVCQGSPFSDSTGKRAGINQRESL